MPDVQTVAQLLALAVLVTVAALAIIPPKRK